MPILMYHSISDGEERVHPYYRVNTSREAFSDQIRFLATHDYKAIGLDQITEKEIADKRVVITFDDGFSDFYFEAFPILREHGFLATVFLATGYVGKAFNGRQCLNWEQIRELDAAGVVFGSHTHTHPKLRDLPRSGVVHELRCSKEIIEDRLGSAVTVFSYPYRFPEEDRGFTEFVGEQLVNAGYLRGVTTIIGRYREGEDVMFLKRLPVNESDDSSLLRAKLNGDYDWLRRPQYLVKRARSIIQ